MLRTFNQAVSASIVVDTGLILEYLNGSEEGKKVEVMIFQNPYIISVFVSQLTLIELYYLIRRKSSPERAKEELDKVRKITQTVPLDDFLEIVGEIKATTSFALADCATLALADLKKISALFKHESEIDARIAKDKSNSYVSRIVFIDDFQSFTEKT